MKLQEAEALSAFQIVSRSWKSVTQTDAKRQQASITAAAGLSEAASVTVSRAHAYHALPMSGVLIVTSNQ